MFYVCSYSQYLWNQIKITLVLATQGAIGKKEKEKSLFSNFFMTGVYKLVLG